MNDLISGKARRMIAKEAIETLKANYPDACYEQLREAVDAAIEALKAQNVTGDTISRQAAIDAFYKYPNVHWTTLDILTELQAFPSAQPEVAKDTNVPSNDCISRQAAIDAMCSACGYDCDKSEFVYNAPQDEQVIMCPEHYALSTLPSARPEWGLPVDVDRPLADKEIVSRLRDIQKQIGGSYAIDRAIEVIEAVAEQSTQPEPYAERRTDERQT